MKIILFILFILSSFFSTSVYSLVFSDREFVLNPLNKEFTNIGDNEFKALQLTGVYAEFANYVQGTNTDIDHYWKGKLSGSVEFFRIGNWLDFTVSGDMEMIADPISQIKFFPRSIFWTEDFILSKKESFFTWQTGFYQRCKHDVDNFRLYYSRDTGEERGLIFDSIPFRMIFNPVIFNLSDDKSVRTSTVFYWKNDFYVILQDSDILIPTSYSNRSTADKLKRNGLNNIETLIDSITIGAHNDLFFLGIYGSYLNTQLVLDFYGQDKGWNERFRQFGHINLDYFIELGFILQTENRFCFFLSVERQQDTLIHPYPQDSTLVYIGVKAFDPKIYL
jgi:hypothetical protein